MVWVMVRWLCLYSEIHGCIHSSNCFLCLYISVSSIKAYGRHLSQKILVNFGSSNGLWHIESQAITWTNADLLSIGPLGASPANFNRNTILMDENAVEYVVCTMAAILFRPQSIKSKHQPTSCQWPEMAYLLSIGLGQVGVYLPIVGVKSRPGYEWCFQ